MTRLAPCWILYGVMATSATSAAAALPLALQQDEPDPPWAERTTDQLVLEVSRRRDMVDFEVFDVLAERGDHEALLALQRCADIVYTEPAMASVFEALTRFAAAPELADQTRTWLGMRVMGGTWLTDRAATRALLAFGTSAVDVLGEIVSTHSDPTTRYIAVGGLVTALRTWGDEASLVTLLDNYRHPDSGPRELGVRTLRAFSAPWALRRFRKTLDDREAAVQTKTMILEALVSMPGEEVQQLLEKALRARQPAVQLFAIQALRARGGTSHLPLLERLERASDAAVRRAAFVAQAPIRLRNAQDAQDARNAQDGQDAQDAKWLEKVYAASTSRDYARRLAAVEVLTSLRDPGALPRIRELLEDGSHLVRAAAARALSDLGGKPAIPLLIERMQRDSLRVRAVAREALNAITGVDHGPLAGRWELWWAAEGEAFVVPSRADAAAANAQREERLRSNPTQADFYGIRIDSDRVCFVVDTSGSMAGAMYSGGSRLAVVTRELVRTLEAFPQGGMFNLIFFSKRVRAWKPHLVERNERSLKQATSYARQQHANGATALYDGLLKAFDDEEVDTIVLLSDGKPTEGALTEAVDILEDIALRNELRRIVIHCISVNHVSTVLEGLAEITGGTYRAIR